LPWSGKERRTVESASEVRRVPVWAVVALGLALAATLVAALAFGGHAASAATATDLRITKTVKPKIVTVGDNQTFIIRVTNTTSRNATNVKVTDPLPTNVRFIRASTSLHKPGSCGETNRTVECDLGTLQGGERVTIKIFVKNVKAGDYVNRAFVSHKSSELDASDNFDTARASAERR
jgi:uncharacterized repeat protein (TIGR01451 family)